MDETVIYMTTDHEHGRMIMPETVSKSERVEESDDEEESIDVINTQDEAVKEV